MCAETRTLNDRRARSTLTNVGLFVGLALGLLAAGNVLLVLLYGMWRVLGVHNDSQNSLPS